MTVEAGEWKDMASGDKHSGIPQELRSWADLTSATLTENRVPFQNFFPFKAGKKYVQISSYYTRL